MIVTEIKTGACNCSLKEDRCVYISSSMRRLSPRGRTLRDPPRRKGEYHCFKKGEMAKCLWGKEMLPPMRPLGISYALAELSEVKRCSWVILPLL